ncbi:hypothetical protein LCGC14_3148350, partial [marine sediment metagenome]
LGGSQGVSLPDGLILSEARWRDSGKSRVKDVIIENDQAVGVRLEDGTEHRADIVVWAGDGHTVIFDILGGRYLDDEVRSMYNEWTPVLPLIQVLRLRSRSWMCRRPQHMSATPETGKDRQTAGTSRRRI